MDHQGKTLTLKTIFVILIVQLCLAIILYSFYNYENRSVSSYEFSYTSIHQELANDTKIILVWTWPFGDTFPLNECPPYTNISGCFYTANRTLYSSADAIVMHHRDVCYSRKQLPQIPKPPNQYWIWFNLESPSHSPNLHFMDNLINLTMSFRADSDIFSPYGWLELNQREENFTIPPKTKLVAWAISNWNPKSNRVRYYKELKKFLPVDIYGRQHLALPTNEHEKTLSKYKFYLAFENSIHEDYITEKLWKNALKSGCVPVVLGPPRKNYERFIPKDSFLHVDDFSTPEELAKYILKLDSDDKAYQQYFTWRSRLHPAADTNWQTHYCRVCKAIKEAPAYKTISKLGEWYK
ncbi:4-galactosyl-N-acetylglucosaminide 3-alpha-L-fucosyltransferase FUT6-like [Bufo gargarizans]|uniref:4-galactosyl-N-acetylglucosaminide 3-alpha-L-fucosyltransferase FUT6-like n=1 Tax=Bufo gargarizans TaxID=30331 RepID=UPI001CF4F7B6|nr:4-galactosyl-N-acetylglucosaminide 3-alpha-L-fucosyltransferase FUT6-like [Bufo gargarizans]XP_044125661.1 4-galactosyl-N-acetylglucosaminide 3-alpha-L-fucosyltransferase FUT6-like [Bufo gargarizans]XP_044125662.1 4-galactosyl-N-acetylglucosaminide 3-alpha-L-fucosyltransferase FUT6-like [Bufo gargarizans]